MTEIKITVPKKINEILARRASERGQDISDYMAQLAEREATMPVSLRELFAPVREQSRASGITDDALEKEIDEAIKERREARGKRGD